MTSSPARLAAAPNRPQHGRAGLARQPLRAAVELAVCLLLAMAFVSWHVGWFIVAGGSMADALLGPHYVVACGDCGFPFVAGADEPGEPQRVVCPNCDHWQARRERLVDGDRLLVHRAAFACRAARRWEAVVFRSPQGAGRVSVKRIVGLPRETIELAYGDIYANGVIQRKTLAQQRALAILVHDSAFMPADPLPLRWQGGAHTAWQHHAGRFSIPSDGSAGNRPIDWLTYNHWRRLPGQPLGVEPSPITDRYGYNQTRPVTRTHEVNDLLLSCRITTSGSGLLALWAAYGQERFLVEIEPAQGRCRLLHNGRTVASAHQGMAPGSETHLELSLIDRQVLLALDGVVVFSHPWEPASARRMANGRAASGRAVPNEPDNPLHDPGRPIAIGSRGLGIELAELRLYRDIYYIAPDASHLAGNGDAGARKYRLGDNEYFVLGDNSPFSADSRDWAPASLPGEFLLGKPLAVHYPSRRARFGGLSFQVPDLSRIRYIH